MNFFKNIKHNYYAKLIRQLIEDKNYEELRDLFLKLYIKKDMHQLNELFQQNVFDLAKIGKNNFFKNNIIWCNSYLREDSLLISGFLKFYLGSIKYEGCLYEDYSNLIFQTNQLLKIKDISFQQLVNNSYFYQYVLSQSSNTNFLNNQCAFFESDNNLMFTHPYLTLGYVYAVRSPMEVLSIIDNKYKDLDLSINELLNLEQKPQKIFSNDQSQSMEFFKHDWAGNVNSWTEPKMIEGFNGIVINLNDELESSFADLIAHLIQSGMEIDLNYQIISEYVDKNLKQIAKPNEFKLSNNKLKLINRYILETASNWGYELN